MGSIDVGVVLAGGRSERMGTPKAELSIDGETYLDRAVGLLGSRFSEVIVAGGRHASPDARLVPDRDPGLGPLGGILSALAVVGRDMFVMPVDLPLLTADVIERLADRPLVPGQVRVTRADGRVHPLVGAYPADQRDLMASRLDSDDRSVIGFLRAVPVLSLVDVPASVLVDVNTPRDVERLNRSS